MSPPTISCGSLLSTRAELAGDTIYSCINNKSSKSRFEEELLDGGDFSHTLTCPLKDAGFSQIKVSGLPTNQITPLAARGHMSRLMDWTCGLYNKIPSWNATVDAVLLRLAMMRDKISTFSKTAVIETMLKGSDPLTKLAFQSTIENHPYLSTMTSEEKISTLKIILHTINIAILLINLIVMFSGTSSKSVIALQFASIISSLTLFISEIFLKNQHLVPNINVQELLEDLLCSKLESQFVSKFDTRRDQVIVDMFSNYGKKYNLPESILNIAKDRLTTQGSEIITCPETSRYFDYAINVAEKTGALLAKYPGLRDASIVNRVKFDAGIGDGLHQAFSHFKVIQELHPNTLTQLDLMESDYDYWKIIIKSINLRTPYKNLLMEGYPTLNGEFGQIGEETWNLHTSQAESEAMLPKIGKAACALLGIIGAAIVAFSGKGSLTSILKKVKSFIKEWKDTKSLITGFKAAFITIVYDLFGWDIGNIHALKKHAKEIILTLTKASTVSPHLLAANVYLKRKVESYQTEALQILTELTEVNSDDVKEIIKDLKIANSSVSKILSDAHSVSSVEDFRQTPVALYLSGHPGSGKTYFVQHILGPYLAEHLNLSLPSTFSIDASGHFNLVDQQKADHLFTDELGARVDDPLIQSLNALISDVPFTASGAFVKDVKLSPKLVSMCNNEDEIKNSSNTPNYLRALTSRLMQFNVVHNEFQPEASQERDSLTRVPDMSNVAFYRVKCDIQGRRTTTTERYSALQICEMVKQAINRESIAYRQKKEKRLQLSCDSVGPFCFSLLDFIKNNHNYQAFLCKEMHFLFQNQEKFYDSPDLYPLSQFLGVQICLHENGTIKKIGNGLEKLCCERKEEKGTLDFLTNKQLYSSQMEIKQRRETLYLHVTGPPGTGKSTFIRDKLVELATITGYEPLYATAASLSLIKADLCSAKRPVILVLDDVITLKPIEFQGIYDHIPEGSICIMISNIKFADTYWWNKTWYRKHTLKTIISDNPEFKPPAGWYRRLNLPFPLLGAGRVHNPNYSTRIIEFEVLNSMLAEEQWDEFVQNEFFTHVQQPLPTDVTIKYNVLAKEMPKVSDNVYVRFADISSFKSIMSSPLSTQFNFALAMKSMNPKLTLRAQNLPQPKDLDAVEFVYYNQDQSVESYLLSLFPIFQKIFPTGTGATLEIGGLITATIVDSTIYTTAQNPQVQSLIEFRETGVLVRRADATDYFSLNEIKELITSKVNAISHFVDSHPKWSILVILCNAEQLKSYCVSLGLIDTSTYQLDLEDPILSHFQEIINSTKFKLFCGVFITIFSLLTITSIITLSYALYKLFSGKPEEQADVEISDDVYVYHEAQANDWFDDVEEEIAAGKHPKDIPFSKPEFYEDLTVSVPTRTKKTLEQEDYDQQRKVKARATKKKFGFTGRMVQHNPKIVAIHEKKAKKVNQYTSQMVRFTDVTNQEPLNDIKMDKLLRAQCKCTSAHGKMFGTFIGARYVVTCAHLIKKEDFDKQTIIKVTERVHGEEVEWDAIPIYYGFKKCFKNKLTDLLVLYITNPTFPPKPSLIKYCKTVQEFVDHENQKDVLPTAVCYLNGGLKREVLLESSIGENVITTFDKDGEPDVEFNSPIISHEIRSNQGMSDLHANTFVPGACGLLVYGRDTPSGNGWICGVHTAISIHDGKKECEAFPLYRDQLEFIIKSHVTKLNEIMNLTTDDFKNSFLINDLPFPKHFEGRKLFCITQGDIKCLNCFARLDCSNYLQHTCKIRELQIKKDNIHYSFDGERLTCDVPEWWEEILKELHEQPHNIPNCAIKGDKLIKEPELTYLGKSWFKLPSNTRPRYKPAPYAHQIPYPVLKKPAALHPSQIPEEFQKNLDDIYKVEYEGDKIISKEPTSKNIQSNQIKLMYGGETDQSCFDFFGSKNFNKASLLFKKQLHKVIHSDKQNLKYRFLTDDEVVNGITNQNHPLAKCIYGMDLDSEAGPTTSYLGTNLAATKRELFEEDATPNRDGSPRYKLKSEPAKFWYRVRDNAKKGIVTFCPDHLKLKNENLKIEKVNQGKTRAYISRDVFGMMLEKKAFGFLQGLFHLNQCKQFSAIGADPQKHFAPMIQRFYNKNCTNLICYDVSRWDKNTLRIILERVMKALLEYLRSEFSLTQEQENTIRVVFASVLDTYFITGSDFFYNGRSMPSGTYLTALVNTLINEFCLCLLVSKIARDTGRDPDKIMELICSIFMGDDGVIAFPDSLLNFFEPKLIQSIYKKMNIELTSTTKDGSDIGVVSLMDFEFCSRTIKIHEIDGERFISFPLKEISVKSDSHWVTSLSNETRLSICRTKLQEACLHGKEFYESEVAVVRLMLASLPSSLQGEILILPWEQQLTTVIPSASTEFCESKKDIQHFLQIDASYTQTDTSNLSSYTSQFKKRNSLTMSQSIDVDTSDFATDYVSEVQRYCQKHKFEVPEYIFKRADGPDHEPSFYCGAVLTRGEIKDAAQTIAISKKLAKQQVARKLWQAICRDRQLQMDRGQVPTANDGRISTTSAVSRGLGATPIADGLSTPLAPTGDASFDPMITTQTTVAPVELVQPSIEPLENLVNYGDPREFYDAIKTQQIPIRDISFNASAAPGNIIAKIPYGPDYLPDFMAEYFNRHKYFKGAFSHTLVLYSNATITGAIRISHVKDIDQDIYTRQQLVETNHSELMQLNQVSTTSNYVRTFEIDYAAQADKVLPVQEVVNGTYKWVPSRPGVVITLEVPVQQIYGQTLNLTLQHYTCWGKIIVSTPILTKTTNTIAPGSRTILEATQGMTLETLISSLEPGLDAGDLTLTTDGFSYPSPVFTRVKDYIHTGIEFAKPADIEFLALTGGQTESVSGVYSSLKLANAVININGADPKAHAGQVWCRLFLLEGDAPWNMDNAKTRDSYEKAFSQTGRIRNDPPFPYPTSDFTNTDQCLAAMQQGFIDTYNERCTTALQTFSAVPFKLLSIVSTIYNGTDVYMRRAVDLTKTTNTISCKAILCTIGTRTFRIYAIDLYVDSKSEDWLFGFDYSNGRYVVHDVFQLTYTPPTAGVSTIPLVSTWKNFSRLPVGCKSFCLINPQTSAIVTSNGNEGLPTVTDTKYTAALLQFLDINTPENRLCRITLMQSGTGRVIANIYYSKEYRQMFIAGTSATAYAAFIGQPSSSYVISSVTFLTPSESFQTTDDSAWSNRAVQPATQRFYKAQMMLATALSAGFGAVSGLAGGINSAIQQQAEFKRQQLLQQERLDYVNRWNQLSAETQLKTNEVTNATNLAVASGNNLTSSLIADKNNANALAIVDAQNSNRISLANINRDTSLSGYKNQLDIAALQTATQLGTKQIDQQIAQGNNATSLGVADIAATASVAGNVLGLTGSLANTGVGIAKVVTDYLQGDKNRENQLQQIHVKGDEDRKTIDHRLAAIGGNIAASQ
nr:polyprotein [Solenopsis invicta virus 10]